MDVLLENLHNLGFDTPVAIANFINFLIIFFILKVLFFERVKKTLAERRARIEQGIEDARIAKEAKAHVFEERHKVLSEAERESQKILDNAKVHADSLVDTRIKDAEKSADSIVRKAHLEFDTLKNSYEKEMGEKLPKVIVHALERILTQKIDIKENEQIIRKALTQSYEN